MAILSRVRGEQFTTRQVIKYLDGEYSLDGLRTASVLFLVALGTRGSNLLSQLPRVGLRGEQHPLYGPAWRAFRYRWRHHERVGDKFVFLQVDYLSTTVDANAAEEEADSIAADEPILSHKHFLQGPLGGSDPGLAGVFPNNRTVNPSTGRFEGTPAVGAIFDRYGQNITPTAVDYNPDVGKFLYFAPGFQLAGEAAGGLERYRVPRGTYARSYITTTRPSLAGVGLRYSNPKNSPALASGWGWLMVRKGYRRLGFVYRVGEGYEAGKWLSRLYTSGDA